jgi:TPR repeat protein
MNINEIKYYQLPKKIIMKKFALMILIVGLVGVCSGVASGQTLQDGLDAYDKKNYKKALEILRPLAEQGDAEAQFKVGNIYDYGRGVSRDFKQAYKWYKLSADKGNGFSIYGLAWLYRNGQGVEKNQNKSNELIKKGLEILRPLAEQGDATAKWKLGQGMIPFQLS